MNLKKQLTKVASLAQEYGADSEEVKDFIRSKKDSKDFIDFTNLAAVLLIVIGDCEKNAQEVIVVGDREKDVQEED